MPSRSEGLKRLVFETQLDAPAEAVWRFHRSVEALRILTPPDRKVEVIGDDLEVRDGALHVLRIRQFGVPMVWKARISEVGPNGFTDIAEKSPFARWQHRHEFLPLEGGTLLRDTVDYALPLGLSGIVADRFFVRGQIEAFFAYRHRATALAMATDAGR